MMQRLIEQIPAIGAAAVDSILKRVVQKVTDDLEVQLLINM